MYEERTYREWVNNDSLKTTVVSIGESDLMILAACDVSVPAGSLVAQVREEIEMHIRRDESFVGSLSPYDVVPDAPAIVRRMAEAGRRFGVGPMAAVAGAVSEYVGEGLRGECDEVIIENGGDIYMRCKEPVTMSLYGGEKSPFTGKVKFIVEPRGRSLGVCTSSGTVGHSTSFGCADSVTVVCDSAVDADAAATALCNAVRCKSNVDRVIERARGSGMIRGIIVAIEDKLGVWGEVELI